MKILLVNNPAIKKTLMVTDRIVEKLQENNIVPLLDSEQYNLEQDINLIIVLGGDGTILRTARRFLTCDIPILGVNMGTVGFLSNIEENELDQHLANLLSYSYKIEERMMLDIQIFEDNYLLNQFFCLNEMALKSMTSKMISLEISVGGQQLKPYRGDGLILATPTGSTAYSLSSGGPITDPDMEAIIMTPIAPYVLSKRPIVIAPYKEIVICPLKCDDAIISIDGDINFNFKNNYKIKIKKAEYKLKFIDLKNIPFLSKIESRLRRAEGYI